MSQHVLCAFALFASTVGDAYAEPIVLDANNRFVGFYQGLSEQERLREIAVSGTGYRFAFDRNDGRIMWPQGFSGVQIMVFFTTPNCTGQAYVTAHPHGIALGSRIAGTVVVGAFDLSETPSPNDPPVYYLPQLTPERINVSRQSWWVYGGPAPQTVICQSGAPDPVAPAYPILPNDPVETGVPNTRLGAPLRIGSSWLFRDGFEPRV